MLKLQDVKVGLAEAALGEGTGTKLHKLSVKDIKYVSQTFFPWTLSLTSCPALRDDEASPGSRRGSSNNDGCSHAKPLSRMIAPAVAGTPPRRLFDFFEHALHTFLISQRNNSSWTHVIKLGWILIKSPAPCQKYVRL
jgi:hypothetical protein